MKNGQKVDLTKTNPGLKEILIGLGWNINKYDGGFDFELYSSVFLLGANSKVTSDGDDEEIKIETAVIVGKLATRFVI